MQRNTIRGGTIVVVCCILTLLLLPGCAQSAQMVPEGSSSGASSTSSEAEGTDPTSTVVIGDTEFEVSTASVKADDGSWTWSAGPGYDSEKALSTENNCGTLELKKLSLSFSGTHVLTGEKGSDSGLFALSIPAGTIVNVSGTNRIENLSHGDFTIGMRVNGDVLFTGDGTLDVADLQTSSDTQSSTTIGIFVSGTMVAEGPHITAAAGVTAGGETNAESCRSDGLYIGKDLVCTRGSVKASGGMAAFNDDSSSNGISAYGNVQVRGSGTVTGLGAKARGMSYGLQIAGDLTISDQASLEGNAGDTARYADGVLASGSFIMKGGSLTAIGGNSIYNSYGLYIEGTAEISAGKTNIRSGNIIEGATEEEGAVSQACGFFSDGTTYISGGNVYVQVGDNIHYSGSTDNRGAALVGTGLEITGGTVQAICTSDGTAVQALEKLSIADTMKIMAAKSSIDSFDIAAIVADNAVACANSGETLAAVCVKISPIASASSL